MGDWEKAERCFDEALNVGRDLNEYWPIAEGQTCYGRLFFAKEEYGRARESLENGLKEYGKAGVRWGQEGWSRLLIATLIELSETEKASGLLDKLRVFSQETGDKSLINDEMELRSRLLRAQKKYAESLELFDKTLREWESIKANIWNAYSFAGFLSEYARAYLERDQPGDKEKALGLLNRALEMFQKMGAKKDTEKVEARVAFIETGKAVSKPKPIEPVPTGYADLDKLLYGGIPSNCAVVLTSPSCNERDMLVKSFLETGGKEGEITFHLTIDPGAIKPLAEEFASSFSLFVCNPQADAIIKDAANVFKLKGVENLTDISIALTSTIRKLDPSIKGPRRICLGLVSDVLLQHHTVQTRRWLAGLIPELKSEGFTILAVIDSRIHPPEELYAIVGLFDGEISIRERETEKGTGRFLKIQKMSGQKYLEDELLLKKEQQ